MTAPTTPLEIAVVGHTNVGKTSLLRTLTRQRSFGAIADSPGTTRHVESIDLRLGGAIAVRYYDTPGLEDAAALQQYLKNLPGEGTPVERVRAFLAGPEAHAAFEQEAKVLRTLLKVDAAIYVIDCREEVLPKYRYEIEILSACGKPVMPVLNFLRDGHSHEAQWREVLAAYHLHAWVQFDAVAPFTGAERQLYQDLGVLLRARRPQLQAITEDLQVQAQERRHAATQRRQRAGHSRRDATRNRPRRRRRRPAQGRPRARLQGQLGRACRAHRAGPAGGLRLWSTRRGLRPGAMDQRALAG